MGRSKQPTAVSSRRIVRYAVVGLGHIAQVAMLPEICTEKMAS